ncbi:hypothetical protein F0562_031829 [Nyssa sinensis]|uniref:Uncharacterized protein n=1 Tax=Nyssa sinensis TaxID=561372 RepID=A0A5J5AVK1_9ASTE|nr:hypothetical protein F0562_031829 [Nyssa sinensis]
MNHLALDANCHPSEYYYASALVPRYLNPEGADGGDISLDEIFSEDDSDVGGDAFDSDGFLSEESSCPHIAEGETASILEGRGVLGILSLFVVIFGCPHSIYCPSLYLSYRQYR